MIVVTLLIIGGLLVWMGGFICGGAAVYRKIAKTMRGRHP
jgi:hypothetical protein